MPLDAVGCLERAATSSSKGCQLIEVDPESPTHRQSDAIGPEADMARYARSASMVACSKASAGRVSGPARLAIAGDSIFSTAMRRPTA